MISMRPSLHVISIFVFVKLFSFNDVVITLRKHSHALCIDFNGCKNANF